MTFLNPAILFGLIAAAIPLIIHLFNFRKPKSVDFSSLAFLEELRQQTMRRLRLKQWLLLALRMLAIACLVLAFARPTVESGVAQRIVGPGRSSVAVILDNSVSMLQRDQNGDYFSQARDELLALAGDLNTGDELTIIPLVADPTSGPARLASPALASDWIADLDVKAGVGRLAESIEQGLSALEQSSFATLELILISDFQATTFTDSIDVEIPPGVRVYLVPIGSTSHDNTAITRVDVTSSIVDLDQPVSLQVTVTNYGETELMNWGVNAFLGDARVAQATLDLGAGESADIDLVMSPGERGWIPGYVEIEDDDFDFDNRRYFTLHVPQVRRVLVVRGEGTDSRHVELALSQEVSRDGSVFDVNAIDEQELSSIPIADYDAVILHGVRFYSSGQIAALSNFVSGGGGLLIFVGESGPAADQQALLTALGGGRLTSLSGQPEADAAVATLDGIDSEHPVFSGVFDWDEQDPIDVGHPAVFRMAGYRPGPGDEHTIMTSTSGTPFLQEIRGGQGRVMLAPFVPEPAWTDLPLRGLFVPLLHRSMYYLTSSEGESGEGATAGSEAQYRLGTGQESRVVLVSAEGDEWIPEQRGGLQGLLITIPAAIRNEGVYDITADGTTIQRIAINGDPAESNLTMLDAQEAADLLESPGNHPVVVLESSASKVSSNDGARRVAGIEIWNVFLGLALVFLVVEMLVAKR
jgi:hypothetical protein